MKNMVLGILGIFIGIYTIVVSLSIYSMQTRKNELENCLSQVVKHTLETYYESGYDFLSTTTIWESDIEDEIEEKHERYHYDNGLESFCNYLNDGNSNLNQYFLNLKLKLKYN